MENYHTLFPGSLITSQTCYLGNYANEMTTAGTEAQHLGARKNISESGASYCSESERKSGLQEEDDRDMKRHKYAFQTRSQVDILDDGYRWRKYGQKSLKNSKFPRSYYRCTYKGCNVKKQIQRNSGDEEVVVTTYEGIHTHPTESLLTTLN